MPVAKKKGPTKGPKTIEAYLAPLAPAERAALEKVRRAMLQAAPDATEVISYSMPGIRTTRVLAWFAAFPNHLSFFAWPHLLDKLPAAKPYRGTKSALHFTAAKPLPVSLVKAIVKAARAEAIQKDAAKPRKKAAKSVEPDRRRKDTGGLVGGKRVGPWTFYHSDGRTLKAVGAYDQKGRFTGPWKWYAANGNLRQEGSFLEGEQHGEWKRYYGGTAQLVDAGRYERGKRVGKWEFYGKDGKLRRTRVFGAKA